MLNFGLMLATRLIPKPLNRAIKKQVGLFRTDFSIERLKAAGFSPKCGLDLGANAGDWTSSIREQWPNLPILMVEAWPTFARELESSTKDWHGCSVAQAVLAERSGDEVRFIEDASCSYIAPADDERPGVVLSTTSLDDVTRDTPFASPDLIKFDLQGAELHVLKGGTKTIACAEVLQIELNVLPLIKGAPLIREVIDAVTDLGFRLYDFGDFMRRPSDRALYWLDGFFVRENSKLLQDRQWS